MSLTALGAEQIAQRLYRYESAHRPLPGPRAVTDEDVAAYRRFGFIAVADLFTAAEVEAACAALSRLVAGAEPQFQGVQFEETARGRTLAPAEREPYVRKLYDDFTAYDPRLKAMATKPAFVAIVERLLGATTRVSQEMALLKPPHIGREKPWHQDLAYFLLDPPDGVLGTWIALDEATPENGCMHVIPGSHRGGPRPHYHDRDCQLPDECVQVDQDVMVPLAPGGVLFFHSLLHHGTPPNRSPARRRALQFHFASVHCRTIDAAAQHARFFDRNGPASCTGHLTGLPDRPIGERPD